VWFKKFLPVKSDRKIKQNSISLKSDEEQINPENNKFSKITARLEVRKIIARHDKPLSDGEFLKQTTYLRSAL
jgi:hypothetical protein